MAVFFKYWELSCNNALNFYEAITGHSAIASGVDNPAFMPTDEFANPVFISISEFGMNNSELEAA